MRRFLHSSLVSVCKRTSGAAFMINKSNLENDYFHNPELEYPDYSHLSIEERIEPLEDYFDTSNLIDNQISDESLRKLITTSNPREIDALRTFSNHIVEHLFGNMIYLRGIIEFSNICRKNCYYCGIRKDNSEIERYNIPRSEIIDLAMECYENQYGTLMLQSGENQGETNVLEICEIIKDINIRTNNELCIALSVGELSRSQYEDLYSAGARRYLLRIETSNPELYSTIHPSNEIHSWQKRDDALSDLLDIGYYVGTGVLVNIPGQNVDDLVNDLRYITDKNVDMIGIGPYIVQNNTPMAEEWEVQNSGIDMEVYNQKLFNATMNMYSLTRILNPKVNMSATTALQLIDPCARQKALFGGANVVMPILTPAKYRKEYKLYERKVDVDTRRQRDDLFHTIEEIGKTLLLDGSWGDPQTK